MQLSASAGRYRIGVRVYVYASVGRYRVGIRVYEYARARQYRDGMWAYVSAEQYHVGIRWKYFPFHIL
jgi:hypothetical protein